MQPEPKIWEVRDRLFKKLVPTIERLQGVTDPDLKELLALLRDLLLANALDARGGNSTKAILAALETVSRRQELLEKLRDEEIDIDQEFDELVREFRSEPAPLRAAK